MEETETASNDSSMNSKEIEVTKQNSASKSSTKTIPGLPDTNSDGSKKNKNRQKRLFLKKGLGIYF